VLSAGGDEGGNVNPMVEPKITLTLMQIVVLLQHHPHHAMRPSSSVHEPSALSATIVIA